MRLNQGKRNETAPGSPGLKVLSTLKLSRPIKLGRKIELFRLSLGHTDSIGGADYNASLSKRRADSVKAQLVKRYGIKAARLTTSGAGATEPKATNGTLQGRAVNRRVELKRTDR